MLRLLRRNDISSLLAALSFGLLVAGSANVSVSNTAHEIIYTPFLCNATTVLIDPDCSGAWQVQRNTTNIGGIPTVSTRGPSPEGANIIPQMFMAFRASALYLSTSVISNATANFTITSKSVSATRIVNSAAGLVAIVNLVESELTTLAVTFIPQTTVSRLDIGSILLTVSNRAATSSFLPTMSLPPSMSPPTFIPSTSASPFPSKAAARSLPHRAAVTEALSLVLGLGVGLSIIVSALFFWWRRRRRLKETRQTWF
ncbi:hypothetical protein MIND_00322400 [Mycena indigotica]|uniref:Uncharacterized protein n=1 Tax=Mycena indigotica TaxID=2126181 RepID=A0A8H6T1W4_9AGAR|nr:uncharacterized protein MIND_00322400 [Mycena indigotica]KAF7309516.1 hypothetical protein MIND_00322400 [Mycena indigotica]